MRLFLIPAFACDGDLFDAASELLRADFDCRVVVPARPSLEACARDVVEAAGGQPFAAWGISLGGHVAHEAALLAPDQARGLILSGAPADAPADPSVFDRRRAAIEADGGAAMLEEMARTIVFEPEGRGQGAADCFRVMAGRASRDALLAQTAALAGRTDRHGALAGLAVPTLLLWGDHDLFSPVAAAHSMAAAMPDAAVAVLEECGHLPSLEAPMRAVAEIRRFFVGDPVRG